MNFAGTPAGIDARKVVDTGIAHRRAGVGQIGAGITRAPLECFTKAATALASTVPNETLQQSRVLAGEPCRSFTA